MKVIGLLGGMSRESTATYYRAINQVVKECLSGLQSARCVPYTQAAAKPALRPCMLS